MVDDARWRQAKDEHQAALAAFLVAARAVPDPQWNEPPREGKWSPAQIAEHLRLTYATIARELRGDTGFRVRVGRLRQLVLRLTVLRRLRRERAFPPGAPAVREVRPGPGPFERQATLAGLQVEADGFGASLDAGRNLRTIGITHPFFGKLGPFQGLELMTLHTSHHRAQLGSPAGSGAEPTTTAAASA